MLSVKIRKKNSSLNMTYKFTNKSCRSQKVVKVKVVLDFDYDQWLWSYWPKSLLNKTGKSVISPQWVNQ